MQWTFLLSLFLAWWKTFWQRATTRNPVFTRIFYRRLSQSLENASENINLLDFMAIDCCFNMNFLSRLLPKHQRQLKLLKIHNFTNFARIAFQLHLDATTKILWIFYMTLFLLASFMLFSFPGALLFRVTCTNFSFCMLEEK